MSPPGDRTLLTRATLGSLGLMLGVEVMALAWPYLELWKVLPVEFSLTPLQLLLCLTGGLALVATGVALLRGGRFARVSSLVALAMLLPVLALVHLQHLYFFTTGSHLLQWSPEGLSHALGSSAVLSSLGLGVLLASMLLVRSPPPHRGPVPGQMWVGLLLMLLGLRGAFLGAGLVLVCRPSWPLLYARRLWLIPARGRLETPELLAADLLCVLLLLGGLGLLRGRRWGPHLATWGGGIVAVGLLLLSRPTAPGRAWVVDGLLRGLAGWLGLGLGAWTLWRSRQPGPCAPPTDGASLSRALRPFFLASVAAGGWAGVVLLPPHVRWVAELPWASKPSLVVLGLPLAGSVLVLAASLALWRGHRWGLVVLRGGSLAVGLAGLVLLQGEPGWFPELAAAALPFLVIAGLAALPGFGPQLPDAVRADPDRALAALALTLGIMGFVLIMVVHLGYPSPAGPDGITSWILLLAQLVCWWTVVLWSARRLAGTAVGPWGQRWQLFALALILLLLCALAAVLASTDLRAPRSRLQWSIDDLSLLNDAAERTGRSLRAMRLYVGLGTTLPLLLGVLLTPRARRLQDPTPPAA